MTEINAVMATNEELLAKIYALEEQVRRLTICLERHASILKTSGIVAAFRNEIQGETTHVCTCQASASAD